MSWRGSSGHIDANVPDYQKMLQGRYTSSGWSSTPSTYSLYARPPSGAAQNGHYISARHGASSYSRHGNQPTYYNTYQPSNYGLTSDSSHTSVDRRDTADEEPSSYQASHEFDLTPYRSRKTTDYSSDTGSRRTMPKHTDYSSDSGMSYHKHHRARSIEFDLEIPSPDSSRHYHRHNEDVFTSPVKSSAGLSDYMAYADNQSSTYNDGSNAEQLTSYSPRIDTITSTNTSHNSNLKNSSHNTDLQHSEETSNASHKLSNDPTADDHPERDTFFSPPLYKGEISNKLQGSTEISSKGHHTNDLTKWQQRHQTGRSATIENTGDEEYRHNLTNTPVKTKAYEKYRSYSQGGLLSREHKETELSPRGRNSQINHITSAAEAIIRDKDAIIENLRDDLKSKLDVLKEYEVRLAGATTVRGGNSDHAHSYTKLQELEYRNAELRSGLNKLHLQKDTEVEDLEIKLGGVEHEVLQLKSALKKAQSSSIGIKEKLLEKEKEVEAWKEKCSSLSEHCKGLKEKEGDLKRYLSDLPTIEEFTKTAEELATCREENDVKTDQIADLEKHLEENTQLLSERETTIMTLEGKLQQLGGKMQDLSAEVHKIRTEGEGKALMEAQEELADTRRARDRVIQDLEKAKKMLEMNHRRFKQLETKNKSELYEVQERLSQEEEAVMALREEVCRKEEQIAKLRKSVKEFASKHQDLMDENLMLKEQLQQVERMSDDENIKLQRKFVKEMSICFTELQTLVQICVQRAEGKDPNISLLLGMKEVCLDDDEEEGMAGASSRHEEKTLKHWFTKLQQLRGEVEQVRKTICNKYAEEMGDNLNCATQ